MYLYNYLSWIPWIKRQWCSQLKTSWSYGIRKLRCRSHGERRQPIRSWCIRWCRCRKSRTKSSRTRRRRADRCPMMQRGEDLRTDHWIWSQERILPRRNRGLSEWSWLGDCGMTMMRIPPFCFDLLSCPSIKKHVKLKWNHLILSLRDEKLFLTRS